MLVNNLGFPGWCYVAWKSSPAVWGISPPPKLCKFSLKYSLTHFLPPLFHSPLTPPPLLYSLHPSLLFPFSLWPIPPWKSERFMLLASVSTRVCVRVCVCVRGGASMQLACITVWVSGVDAFCGLPGQRLKVMCVREVRETAWRQQACCPAQTTWLPLLWL